MMSENKMDDFHCYVCGKSVNVGVDGMQLCLCVFAKHWQLGSGDPGYARLATHCYCNACCIRVAKQIINNMYGENCRKIFDERSEKTENDVR